MLRTLNVMIVEDIDSMRLLLKEFLDGEVISLADGGALRFRVICTARNVWEARGELSRHRPDLVLLDEILPGESSIDLLEELRTEGVSCILLTGMAQREAPIPRGALGRLAKPGERARREDQKLLMNHIALCLQSGS